MIRLFVSQPLGGRSDEAVFDERMAAMDEVKAMHPGEHVWLVPSTLSEAPPFTSPLGLISVSVRMMDGADLVYMAAGWEGDGRCKVEHLCATSFGKDVVYYDQFFDESEGE